MVTTLFKQWGFTRDDAKWVWGQWLGAAAAIASGLFDMNYWANYLGFQVSPKVEHIITVIAVASMYLSGKMNASKLPGDPAKSFPVAPPIDLKPVEAAVKTIEEAQNAVAEGKEGK